MISRCDFAASPEKVSGKAMVMGAGGGGTMGEAGGGDEQAVAMIANIETVHPRWAKNGPIIEK